MLGRLGFAVIGGFLVGCGAMKDIPVENKVFHAPSSSAEVGYLTKNASKEDITQLLAQFPEVQIRPLHIKRGLYEIHGLSKHQIQTVVSTDQVSHNRYYNINPPENKPAFQNFSTDAFDKFINTCVEYHPEEADFKVTSNKLKSTHQKSYYTLKGESISFKIEAQDKDQWSFISQLTPPKYSSLGPNIQLGSEITLTTDALGVFKAFFVGKNSKGHCYPKIIQVFSSANPEYVKTGLSEKEIQNFNDFSFWHLDELNAKRARQGHFGKNIVIAVIDTGIHFNHPYINNNVWINSAEIPDNKIDDDENGFVDDYLGYDFANTDSVPFDDEGHGTHVAGLAASVIGVAPSAQVMALKAFNPLGVDVGSVTAAIYYAVDHGAQIINASFGWGEDHPAFKEAVLYAKSQGVIIVAAAGNGDAFNFAIDNDEVPSYPSNYKMENILSVTATDENGELPYYANYGKHSVHLAALGGTPEIPLLSLNLANPAQELIAKRFGTSMSAGLTSGALAVAMSAAEDLTAEESISKVIHSAKARPNLGELLIHPKELHLKDLYGPDQGLACRQ